MRDFSPDNVPPFLEVISQKRFDFREVLAINKAYFCAWSVHFNQFRMDGSAYIQHPIAMTRIAMNEFNIYNSELNITLILHDTDEPSIIPFFNSGLRVLFGKKIATNNHLLTKTDSNKKTYLKAIAQSMYWIVILSKLIDRMHNMRTLERTSSEFQKKQATETRKYFLKLCYTLAKVIPEEYKEIPTKIHIELATWCEHYGC